MTDDKHSSTAPDTAMLISKTAEALGMGATLNEAYRDLLQPAARELGQGLVQVARAVNVALTPFAMMTWGFERMKGWLQVELTRRLARTPPKCIAPPRPYVAGPLLIGLTFLEDEKVLRDLFASLLAAEMDVRQRAGLHPAYATVLQQLTPDEAKVLLLLAQLKEPWYMCELTGDSPRLEELFAQLCREAGVQYPKNAPTYLDNLIRLRILSCDLHSTADLIPEGSNDYGDWEPFIDQNSFREIYLSEFGKGLVNAATYPTHVEVTASS